MGGVDIADNGTDSSNGVGEEANVKIRSANGSKFYVQVNLNSTVEDFKSLVAQKCEIPAQQQRLIYKGRVMKDDQTLKSFGLEDNHTVHLVRSFASAAPLDSTTTTDAGIRNTNATSTNVGSNGGRPLGRPAMEQMQESQDRLNMIREMLDVPTVPNSMNNPETIRNLIINNPQIREILDRNPELDIRTPTLTRSSIRNLRSNRSAARFEALTGRTGRGNTTNSRGPNTNPLPNPWASAGTGGSQNNLSGSGIDPVDIDMTGLPGGLGFPDLDQMRGSMPDLTAFYQLIQNPVISQHNTSSNPQNTNQQLQNSHSALAPQIGTQTSQEPAQNDGGTAGNMELDMLINLRGRLANGGGIDSASRPQVAPEERYSTQLSQLQEMGFFDTQESIEALVATEGNVHAAVERLLGWR